jgi:hypothetical protein
MGSYRILSVMFKLFSATQRCSFITRPDRYRPLRALVFLSPLALCLV